MEVCAVRSHLRFRKFRRRRIGVRVERRVHAAPAGPEPCAAHFVRIGFLHDLRGDARRLAAERRRAAPGKTCDGKIEAAPEEMHGTGLSEEARPECLNTRSDLQQHAPKPIGVLGIIRRMLVILRERNGAGNLAGHLVDGDADPQARPILPLAGHKDGHRLRAQRKPDTISAAVRMSSAWSTKSNWISKSRGL